MKIKLFKTCVVLFLVQLSIESLVAKEIKSTSPSGNPVSEGGFSDPAAIKLLTKNIQSLLVSRGFDPGVPDGALGKNTRKAICYYQYTQGMEINPLPTKVLEAHLTQSATKIAKKEYTGIVDAQCDAGHLNNLNNIDSVVNHSYEGALSSDDYMCETIVSPFAIKSNFKILFDGVSKNVINILKRKDSEVRMEQFRLTAKKANWLPLKMEKYYGSIIHEKRLEKGVAVLSRDSKRRDVKALYEEGDKVLNRVLQAIGEEYPYQFKLFVVDDRTINAEAIPGGYVYVNSGVLKTDYADLVVAHEIAHILRRHATKELQAALIDSVETLGDLKKLLSNKSKDPVSILEKALVLRGALVKYSQQQELQSDACSVRIVDGVKGSGLNRQISEYISGIEKNNIKIRGNDSTHPAYADRKMRMLDAYEQSGNQITVNADL